MKKKKRRNFNNVLGGECTKSFASKLAAEAMKLGAQVYRVPDGEGGFYQYTIFNPPEIKPNN